MVEDVELHLGVQAHRGLSLHVSGQAPQPWHRGLHWWCGMTTSPDERTGWVANVDL